MHFPASRGNGGVSRPCIAHPESSLNREVREPIGGKNEITDFPQLHQATIYGIELKHLSGPLEVCAHTGGGLRYEMLLRGESCIRGSFPEVILE